MTASSSSQSCRSLDAGRTSGLVGADDGRGQRDEEVRLAVRGPLVHDLRRVRAGLRLGARVVRRAVRDLEVDDVRAVVGTGLQHLPRLDRSGQHDFVHGDARCRPRSASSSRLELRPPRDEVVDEVAPPARRGRAGAPHRRPAVPVRASCRRRRRNRTSAKSGIATSCSVGIVAPFPAASTRPSSTLVREPRHQARRGSAMRGITSADIARKRSGPRGGAHRSIDDVRDSRSALP